MDSQSPTSFNISATPPPTIDDLVNTESQIIYSISTLFPFELFPTKISVDRTKVNIVRHIFFGSRRVEGILIANIAAIVVNTSLFFAEMDVQIKLPLKKPDKIQHLPKSQALCMRRIIEGLLIANQEHANLNTVQSIQELREKLETIGRAKLG